MMGLLSRASIVLVPAAILLDIFFVTPVLGLDEPYQHTPRPLSPR